MKKKVAFAVLTGGIANHPPCTNIKSLKTVESVSMNAYSSNPGEAITRRLIEKVVREYPLTNPNCILGFNIVSYYDGAHHCLMAYGNPARIEQAPGLQEVVNFRYYEIDV